MQKEVKHSTKSEENSTLAKRSNRGSVKEKQNAAESEKKENNVPVLRPSTRSRYQDDTETVIIPKKIPTRVSLTKHSKATQNSENQSVEKVIQTIKKAKVKPSKTPQKERMANYEKNSKALGDGVESAEKQEKETKKDLEKEAHKINEEGKDKVKEGDFKKGKKSLTNAKSEEKETEIRNSTPSSKKIEKREIKQENSSCSDGKRPTRKCSAADKICFEIDNFTSDEDDFINTFKASKTRASTKKIGFNKDKEKSKKDIDKKFPKALSNVANKNEKAILLHEEVLKEESKKKENKKGKMDSKLKPVVNEKISSKPAIENESQKKLIVEKNVKRSEENKVHQECTAESNECRMLNLKRAKVTSENKKEEKVDTNQSESTNMKISNENSKLVANKQDTESSQNKEILRENLSVSVNIKNVSEVEAKTVQNEVKQGKEALEKDLGGTKDESKKNDTKLVKAVADITEASRTLRDRTLSEELSETSGKCNRRIRPVRQCSTGEKKWIEIDSDSFSLYETSDEEDNLPILDFSSKNKDKSSPIGTDTKECNATEEEKKEKKVQSDIKKKKREDLCSDNFSDSDEEPLKKKALISNNVSPEKSQGNKALPEGSPGRAQRAQREVPDLHPLKKIHSETQPLATTASTSTNQPPEIIEPRISNVPPLNEPKPLLYETKNIDSKSEVSAIRPSSAKELQDLRTHLFMEQGSSPVVSVPNRIEMILHSLKKDKLSEVSSSYSNDVKVTFGNVPYHPISHTSQFIQTPCNYQVKPIISFPQPREPISTHGLDLLSEVALPTTPKEKLNSQTERIEKWLKDSLAVEQKKNFPAYEDLDYKGTERSRIKKCGSEKQDLGLYFGKPPVNVSSQPELQKFGQFELSASQKLLKKNIFAAEVKSDAQKVEQPTTPFKKGLTSVQDLLKLQKERKDVLKSPVENSSHLKNCKCNNCIVKKGWFKNKPVPKPEPQKSCSVEDCEKSAKPFQSLTKALTKVSADGKNPKMSVSVAPIVVTSSSTVSKSVSTPSKEGNEKKGIFQQRKLSFLERMKERERKESASVKPSPNAFSPNNESSVYAFEPEPEQVAKVNAPFRSKTRESRTSSTSKSDDDCLKICEDDSSTALSSGNQVEKSISENKGISKSSQSASIAVQVNLDSETITEVEAISEIQDGKSIEISTQTEVPEEDSESPMFYIPLQQATTTGTAGSSEQQLIQGVAVELGTEGPMGPNQRVVMKAKLVTKPPDAPSIKAVVMPQPKRIFDKKNNNPPIGTVQPTTRKPPEEPKTTDTGVEPLSLMKDPPLSMEIVTQASSNSDVATAEGSTTKSCKNSTATVSVSSTKTREKNKDQNVCKEKGEISEECSPCSSASSSKSKRTSKQKSSETVINPTNTTWLPPAGSASKLVEAPTFHATEKDFQDPFEFFDRIRPAAEKFGLCRIVPPSSFKPDCKVSDDMRFTADNQYVHRMFHRWGPNIKEMMAIKKYLATQSISLKQPPWIGGIEVDLPRLYQSVQNCGGLMKVMEKKKWHQVADMMKIPKAAQDRVTKLDDIYCKYLLPYDTLSHDERQKLFDEVEKDWLERQQSSSESPDSQGDEEGEEENYIEECEECVVKGRNMALNQFYRIARNTMTMWFKNPEPLPREVENEFWKHVSERNHHVCVHSGSIDSSGWGYGFPIAKNNSFSKHPWNLKVLTNNSRSVLRSLGPAMGVTVPTLHVGMVFTAFCWYRDPHGLPWIEYLHTGAPKIWYGISDDNSSVFQDALSKLLPRHIKNKTIWLPSDTAMIPPALLVEHGVSLCHTIQEPGQFILVFPRAFISSICTGYLVSESVYFAQSSWLTTAEQAFKDIQESCEPSMFSLEKLLFSIATDSRSSVDVLKQVCFLSLPSNL